MTARLSPQRDTEIRALLADLHQDVLAGVRASGPEYLAIRDLLAENKRLRAELDRRTEDVAFLERATLPELRRTVQHHIDGKQRWRDRAEKAEARLSAVLDLCDREQRNAMRWENPIPVPDWVATVQGLALGDIKPGTEVAS